MSEQNVCFVFAPTKGRVTFAPFNVIQEVPVWCFLVGDVIAISALSFSFFRELKNHLT